MLNYIKIGTAGLIVFTIMGSAWYVYSLQVTVDELTKANIEVGISLKDKTSALTACSDSIKNISSEELKKSLIAQQAVNRAKKESKVDFSNASGILFYKPKGIEITSTRNTSEEDTLINLQLKDYRDTNDLINNFIKQGVR
jgi:hypothetical protein